MENVFKVVYLKKEMDFVKSNVKYPSVEKCSFLNLIGILLKISTQGWFLLPTAPPLHDSFDSGG